MSESVALDPAVVPPVRPRFFGPWQAIWLIVGFQLIQFTFSFCVQFAASFFLGLRQALRHVSAAISLSPEFLSISVIGSYIVAGLWSYRFVRRRAASRLVDGSPSGVGLRAASWLSYAAAGVLASALLGVVALLFKLIPVAPGQAGNTFFVRALSGPGDAHVVLRILGLAMLSAVSPVLEEFIFRGAAFAGVAGRWGTPAACIVTTVLFVLAHTTQKIHYLPGFVDVTLLAAATLWLRLHYCSIRPAMLCHAMYNIGVVVVARLLYT